ncbi:MAG: PQQ-binding-like beta-propeller repeat protein [Candidatus Solibacter usitatus]|nr:PQQ-binding-like beta-propeller repeat protein [Candidatus Solibacter usitatus]
MRSILFLAAFLAPVAAQDWPQFLGPTRNGVYTGQGSEPAVQLWKKPIGAGFSAPVVAQGKLIVFFREGGKEKVEAWEPDTGKRIWSYSYATNYRDDFGFDEGPRSAPLVDAGRIYTCGAEGQLHAVNLADGKKVWSEDLMSKFRVRKGFFGAVCAPIVDGNAVMVNAGGANAGIVAFDKNNGKVLWTATSDEASYSSPLIATLGGWKRALFFTRAGLVDLDPASGKVRHTFAWRSRSMASVNAATPVVSGDLLFLSASYATGAIAFDVKGDQYKKLWSSDDVLSNHYSTSVERNGMLYGFHGRQEEGQELRCVDWRTGKVRWSAGGMGAGTVTLAGDTLLILREGGEMVAAKADPAQFRALAKRQLLDATVRAYPALAAGRLFLRNENSIACWQLK